MNFEALSAEELAIRLAAIVDSSEDAIVGRDVDGVVNTWNSAAVQLFGYTPAEIIGHSVLLLVPPDLHHEELRNQERVRGGERIALYETQRLRKGGERVDVSLSVSPIKKPSGEIIGSALTARELIARRQEDAARARLAAIVECSDDAIVAKDLNGVITDWNAAAERLFGYPADEIVGRSILTIIPPDLQHEEPVILSRIRAGLRVEHYETQRLHKSGRRLQVSLTMSPIRDLSGRVIGVSKIARDISEQRKLENARLMLAAIVESSDDAIVSKNLDGVILSWNAAAERLFGYKPEEIIGHSVLRLIPRELHYEEPTILARLRSGQRIEHFETRRMKKNGEIFDVSLTVSPIKDALGRVIGGSKILRDISDRRATEAALVQKEKLAAAGRLAATIAHEVNNPLESITNLAYLLSNSRTLDAENRRYAELLLNEAQRAGEITRKTLGFYRESKVPIDVDLHEVLNHVLAAKERKLKHKRVSLEIDFPEVPMIKGFPGELRQVFDNVIDNAIDAVPAGGHIGICARKEREPGKNHLVITISDNGPGIPPEALHKLFQPFFTTKAERGSGLGLWVSRSIIQKHGGEIRMLARPDSDHKKETVVSVELPFSAPAPPNVQRDSPHSTQPVRAVGQPFVCE